MKETVHGRTRFDPFRFRATCFDPFADLCLKGAGLKQQFLACLAAGLLIILPILLFVHRYIDDYGRSMDGDFRWTAVGRPLADLLFFLVNIGSPGIAVAPLHQLLSVGLVAVVGVIAARAHGIRSPLWTAIGTLPLIGQPYGLENLSYGFDSFGMAMAMSLAVIAAVLINLVRSWQGLIVSSLLVIASLCLYQPGASSFLSFGLMLVVGQRLGLVDDSMAAQPGIVKIGRVLASYVLALAGYAVVLLVVFRTPTSYAAEQSQLLPFDSELPAMLLRNALSFWQVFYADWNGWPAAGLCLALGLAYVAVVWGSLAHSAVGGPRLWKRIRACGLALAVVLLIALVSPGALLMLQDPLARVPRLPLFLGPLLAAIQLQIVAGVSVVPGRSGSGWALTILPRAAVVCFAWLLMVVSYAYGHAFAAQADFEQGRISRLIAGISLFQTRLPETTITSISFVGEMPKSPVLANTQRKFPLLDRLVPRLINGGWSWGQKQLQFYGLALDRGRLPPEEFVDGPCVASTTSMCTAEYSLQARGETLLVRMK